MFFHALSTCFYVAFYSKTSTSSSHFGNMGKQGVQGKTAARSSRKEAASLAKGGNSSATKEKNLKKHQACNLQCKQSNIVEAPMKPPPAWVNIPEFARAAAREQLQAAWER
jgi:hypothetical protein